jgi:osmotically inducible lipoprotein OsmB
MRKFFIMAAAALALAGCQTVQQDRALTGAVIGGAAGTVIGAAAGGSAGSAVAGGLIGATAGGLIGASTAPHYGRCYARTRSGRTIRVRCR